MEQAKFEEKVREFFPHESVYKDPTRNKFFSSLNIPSYMRDWLIKRFSTDEGGQIDLESIREFIKEKIPRKRDVEFIKEKLINRQEKVEILAKILVTYDISTGEALFELVELGIPEKKHQARVEKFILEQYREELLALEGTWGVVTLQWRIENIPNKNKKEGRIICTNFKPFKPYKVDIEYFREARKHFTISEWIDLILRSIDYNPQGFIEENSKIWMITRLLPFVEKRVNLIELAPKGTGKSYVFSQLSKYGWLVSGGSMTRAKLFYDQNYRKQGLVSKFDFVAFDEVHTMSFPDEQEMKGALKGYLEYGEYRIGQFSGTGDAGLILLGNVPLEKQDENQIVFDVLPECLKETALLDRFHGFIKGWEIPRMKEGMKANGYGLNVEYLSEILHLLRDEVQYRQIVDEVIKVPKHADTRDVEAIKRLCTALLKLLFPHVRALKDLNPEEFKRYCFYPSFQMRQHVRKQLHLMDKEYRASVTELNLNL